MADQVHAWRKVASDFGIEIITPCEIRLSNGTRLLATALVRGFGAENGMVIDPSYAVLGPHRDTLRADGYGYCAMELSGTDRTALIEMFADWGWTSPDLRPVWLPQNPG
jgi:hypothetical protein